MQEELTDAEIAEIRGVPTENTITNITQPVVAEKEFQSTTTLNDKFSAVFGATDFTHSLIDIARQAVQPSDPNFDINDPKYVDPISKLSPDQITSVIDAESEEELNMKLKRIAEDDRDAMILNTMPTGQALAMGAVMTLASPSALAGIAATTRIMAFAGKARMLKTAGNGVRPKVAVTGSGRGSATVTNKEALSYATGAEKVAITGTMAGTEFGAIEYLNRKAGDENYENVGTSILMGAAIGAGLQSVFLLPNAMRGGMTQAEYADMMANKSITDDLPPSIHGPAFNSVRNYDPSKVYTATVDEAVKKKAYQPSLFSIDKEHTFNVEKTSSKVQWETHGTGLKPLVEPEVYTSKTPKKGLASVIANNIKGYVIDNGTIAASLKKKGTAREAKLNADHSDATKEIDDISGYISKISHGKYDASNVLNEAISESLGQRSDVIKKTGTKNIGITGNQGPYEVRHSMPGEAEQINSKRFLPKTTARRLAEGKGTVADIKKLNVAMRARVDDMEAIYQEELSISGKKPKFEYEYKYTLKNDAGEHIQVEHEPINIMRWEEAPPEYQPYGNGPYRDNIKIFEDEWIANMAQEKVFGNTVNEKNLTPEQLSMETVNDINIVRSTASAWLGKLFQNKITSSGATLLINKAANGEINKKVALLVTKFVTPIYSIVGKNGDSLAARVNTTDIEHQLEKVFGYNQGMKHDAYVKFVQDFKKQYPKEKPITMEQFDRSASLKYLELYSEYEKVLSNKIREAKKDKTRIAKMYDEETLRLNETELVLEDAVDELGKPIKVNAERIKNEKMRKATDNVKKPPEQRIEGFETVDDVVADAVEARLRREVDDTIDINKLYTIFPDLHPAYREYMDADIGYYNYYQRRAVENGLDSEKTWSSKIYHRQMVDKAAIFADEKRATVVLHDSIRQHQSYINAIEDYADEIHKKVLGTLGRDKNAIADATRIREAILDMHTIRLTESGEDGISRRFNQKASDLKARLDRLKIKNGEDLLEEIMKIVSEPNRIAREIVESARTSQLLIEGSFDVNRFSGAPSFFKRRSLAMKMDVPEIENYMKVGSQKNLAAYDYKIKGEMKVHEVFGTRDVDEFIEQQTKEIYGLDQMSVNILRDMFETAKGTKQIADDPHAWSESLARSANQYTYLAAGGGFMKYALSEAGVIAAKHGFGNMVKEIPYVYNMLKTMYSTAKNGKLDIGNPETRDMMAFGEVFELYSRRMKSSYSDISAADTLASANAPSTIMGRTDKALGRAQQEYFKFSGLEGATMFTKMLAARAFMRRLGDVVVLGKVEARDLKRWGFTDSDLGKMKTELDAVGYNGKNNLDFLFHKWSDKQFAHEIKVKINRASQDTILRNQDMHKPFFLSDGKISPIFKTTRLFMSFQFMSQERLLMAGMTDDIARTMAGMGTTAAMLGVAYTISELGALSMGKDEDKAVLPWNKNAGVFYRQLAMMNSYSGNWGMVGQVFGFRNLDGGMVEGKYGQSGKDVTMFIGGAPLGKALTAFPLITEPARELLGDGGNMNNFSRALKQSLPFNNHWLYNEFLNYMFKESGNEISDAYEEEEVITEEDIPNAE